MHDGKAGIAYADIATGAFAEIKSLKYGDQVQIQAWVKPMQTPSILKILVSFDSAFILSALMLQFAHA